MDEFPHLISEGDCLLWIWLVYGFVFICGFACLFVCVFGCVFVFLVGVVVVGGEESCFVGCDDVYSFTWCRVSLEGI